MTSINVINMVFMDPFLNYMQYSTYSSIKVFINKWTCLAIETIN